MVFKLLEAAQKSWRRLDGHNQLPKLVLGVTFNNGIEVIAKPTDRQPVTAAAGPARPSPKFSDSSSSPW
jgi:putative transposase